MKKIISTLFVLMVSILFSNAKNEIKARSLFKQDILYNVQHKIDSLYNLSSNENKLNAGLLEYSNQLKELFKNNKSNLIAYWYAYSKFNLSILELNINKNKTQSEKYIDDAVDVLDNLKNKNSEEYALLSYTKGFSLQFKNMLKVIFRSKSAKNNALKAIELDKNNLRGYYAFAKLDYHTPVKYGGQKEYESHLLKAIHLPTSLDKNNGYLPSWGLEDSYMILIQSYLKKADTNNAKKYYIEAKKVMPFSNKIKSLSTKFN